MPRALGISVIITLWATMAWASSQVGERVGEAPLDSLLKSPLQSPVQVLKEPDSVGSAPGTQVPPPATGTPALPRWIRLPPKAFAAYLGQTLHLSAEAQTPGAEPRAPISYGWIVNRKVVCSGPQCRIPLNGSHVGLGVTHILIIAYSSAGSTSSIHSVNVVQGRWTPRLPWPHAPKDIPLTPQVPTAEGQGTDSSAQGQPIPVDSVRAYTQQGTALWISKKDLSVVGTAPRIFPWSGRLRTADLGVVRLTSQWGQQWFLLPRTTVQLDESPESSPGQSDTETRAGAAPGQSQVKLREGTLRTRQGPLIGTEKTPTAPLREVQTDELKVIFSAPADVFVTREALKQDNKEAQKTSVIVLSGQVKVAVKNRIQHLPTGVEMTVFSDGTLLPLKKPDSVKLQNLIQQTYKNEDILKEKKADTQNSKKTLGVADLNAFLAKIEEHLNNEDHFEALASLQLLSSPQSQGARAQTALGRAQLGLYQPQLAKIHFQDALRSAPSHWPAHWFMAQLLLEQKDWMGARSHLQAVAKVLPSDHPWQGELHYYQGVTDFQLKYDFSAKNALTQALWHPDLSPPLRASAQGFLLNMANRSALQWAVPLGFQYDSNVLSLTNGSAVPSAYPSKGATRALAGVMASREPSASSPAGSIAGAKVFVIRHIQREFKDLDAFVAEIRAGHTITVGKTRAGPGARNTAQTTPPETVASTPDPDEGESPGILALWVPVQVTRLGTQWTQWGTGVQMKWANTEWGALAERDLTGHKKHGLALKQEATIWSARGFEVQGLASQRMGTPVHSTANPHSFEVQMVPAYTYAWGPRYSLKSQVGWSIRLTPEATGLKQEYRASPGTTLNAFLLPWLVLSGSLSYDYLRSKPASDTTTKWGTGLMLTGIF